MSDTYGTYIEGHIRCVAAQVILQRPFHIACRPSSVAAHVPFQPRGKESGFAKKSQGMRRQSGQLGHTDARCEATLKYTSLHRSELVERTSRGATGLSVAVSAAVISICFLPTEQAYETGHTETTATTIRSLQARASELNNRGIRLPK